MSRGHATITRLPGAAMPWRWAMRIEDADPDVFDAVIQSIKTVPSRRRKWDAETVRWLFQDDDAAEFVCKVLRLNGVQYVHDDVQHHLALTPQAAYAEFHLLPSAPAEVVEAAYRALSKMYHPDAGGDAAEMRRINKAVEVLRRERGIR